MSYLLVVEEGDQVGGLGAVHTRVVQAFINNTMWGCACCAKRGSHVIKGLKYRLEKGITRHKNINITGQGGSQFFPGTKSTKYHGQRGLHGANGFMERIAEGNTKKSRQKRRKNDKFTFNLNA